MTVLGCVWLLALEAAIVTETLLIVSMLKQFGVLLCFALKTFMKQKIQATICKLYNQHKIGLVDFIFTEKM